MQWYREAIAAGNALADAIEQRSNNRFLQAQQKVNEVRRLRNDIVSVDMEAWCLDDAILEDPITPAEYEEMLFVRKSNNFPTNPSPEWDRWATLVARHW